MYELKEKRGNLRGLRFNFFSKACYFEKTLLYYIKAVVKNDWGDT